MALALDASTPPAVTALDNVTGVHTVTLTTASFTPPSGAVLVIPFCTNAVVNANSAYAVTDNLGVHLTYTHLTQQGNNLNDVEVNVWWAAIGSSAAMTVSASYQVAGTATGSLALLRPLVFTGADTSSPIGATGGGRGRTTNLSGPAAQYNSTRAASWGWVTYADWTASGIPTVPAGETVDSSYHVTGDDSHAVIKNNATTTPSGTQVTLTTSTPTSALQLSWIYFEVLPATAGTANWKKENYWWQRATDSSGVF